MEIILIIGAAIAFFVIMRSFGAWMLRIDEVIKNLEDIKAILKKQQSEKEKEHSDNITA